MTDTLNESIHLENTLTVIKKADKQLSILAGCLSSPFSNNDSYVYELSNFIEKRDSHIEIILSNYNDNSAKKNSKLLRRLAYYIAIGYEDKIQIKQIVKNLTFTEDEKKEPLYFLLNDQGGYCVDTNYLADSIRFAPEKGILYDILKQGFDNLFNQALSLDILTLFTSDKNDDTVK